MSDIMDPDLAPPERERSEDAMLVEEAVRRYFGERKGPGDILTWEWLLEALGLPDYRSANSIEAFQAGQLRFLSLRKRMERELLTQHNIAVTTVRGEGLRIVLPSEQTNWAQFEMTGELKQALSKASARLRHINLAALDAGQRAENANAIAAFSHLRSMLRSELRRAERLNGGRDKE